MPSPSIRKPEVLQDAAEIVTTADAANRHAAAKRRLRKAPHPLAKDGHELANLGTLVASLKLTGSTKLELPEGVREKYSVHAPEGRFNFTLSRRDSKPSPEKFPHPSLGRGEPTTHHWVRTWGLNARRRGGGPGWGFSS